MKSTNILPEEYKKIYSVDMQKDKKMMIAINLAAALIAVVMIVPMNFLVPISSLFDTEIGTAGVPIRVLMLAIGYIAYIIFHELVHGVAMKICGTKKVKYGFKGVYAYAGSDDYYTKASYIFIALAPVVLWGAVLLIINLFVPTEWFWVVYFIQVGNISGAAGDCFVTLRFSRLPKDILIRDHGVGMEVYAK